MYKSTGILIAFLSVLPNLAEAQIDCNQLARDLVVKNYNAASSDYYKLLFLSSLTQMSEDNAKEALAHSGKVSVGPISIGPGTWNKDSQRELRSKLEKIVNIEQIRQNAASVSASSGDPNAVKAVETCIFTNGGLYLALNDRGKETAVLEMMWVSPPQGKVKTAAMESVTIVNGKLFGANAYAKRGAQLEDRVKQRITIQRTDPKKDLTVVVSTLNAGSGEAYRPPSELPPPPPPKIVRAEVKGEPVDVGSGAHYDGGRNPGCQYHEAAACVSPKNGGKLVPGAGRFNTTNRSGNAGTKDPIENTQQYCITVWANTGACQTPVFMKGYAAAIEEYSVSEE